MGAIFKGLKAQFFRNEAGNKVDLPEHIHDLGLDDGERYRDASFLQFFDSRFYGIQPALVDVWYLTHPDDNQLSLVRYAFHLLPETRDGTKKHRSIQALNEYFLQ